MERHLRVFVIATVFGLIFATGMVLASFLQLSAYGDLVAVLFSSERSPLNAAGFFHAGVAGALYAGWSLTLLLLAKNERLAKEKVLWDAIFWGVLLWFVLDNLASVATGASYNLIGNTMFFGMMMWPVTRMRKNTCRA